MPGASCAVDCAVAFPHARAVLGKLKNSDAVSEVPEGFWGEALENLDVKELCAEGLELKAHLSSIL